MTLLKGLRCPAIDEWGHGLSSLMWLSWRGILVTQVLIKIDACRVRGCDLMLLDTSDIVLLDLGGCKNITDQCLIDIVKHCHKPRWAHLGDREKVLIQVYQRWVQDVVSCRASILKAVVR